ncbi:bifunctional lysylphosphatidylglycerol flippase/synthetase MprF [Pararhizobium mangrovi]|uniref:Bifunctional lysylphosphatidylglycerol flippase/synthetase MprF n=1 Tax=Pararhizobium mangrovi TaxID=2590452 RepID=A0A506UER2_9HYPH|nr:bifunctional lysylphosphatidylglycerol flippase/synthetase MprF [Pararhizobium mangrovi]TPW31946.1 bifunctional lysylphosphatidylglycerol flippase/synthetase MprF [Pararhizobium mangrovi]
MSAVEAIRGWSLRTWHRLPTHLIGPVVAIGVTLVAFYMLHGMTSELSLGDLDRAFSNLPTIIVLWSLVATAASYCALATYDISATRIAAPGKVSWPVASVAGMAGFAFSNFLGFHLVTGGAVRYRIYARLGLDGAEIAKIILLTWSGLWLAITGLIATAVIISPAGIPFIHLLNTTVDRVAGTLALIGLVALFVYAGRDGREFRLWNWQLILPGRGPLFLQLVAGLLDIAGATYALYVLIPPDVQPGFAPFVVIYLSAVVLAVVSHVPGGVGVFEVTMMAALGASGRADVLAALMVYRIIYYVLPFVVAAAILAVTEVGWLKQRFGGRFSKASRFLRPLVPPVAAVVASLAGLVLVFSSAVPHAPFTLALLHRWVPLAVLEGAHFAASLIGFSLIVVAWGLRRRLKNAWRIAVGLLVAAMILAPLKGLDWYEGAVMLACLVVLVMLRGAFQRSRPERLMSVSTNWLAFLVGSVAATIWLGVFSYQHGIYHSQMWWHFGWQMQEGRFLRASAGLVLALVAVGVLSLLHRPKREVTTVSKRLPSAARHLIERANEARANAAWTGDKTFLIAEDNAALLMYARSGRSLVSLGDPIGDKKAYEELVWQLRELAERQALRAVFYAVRPRSLPIYLDMGFAIFRTGESARVRLATFAVEGPGHEEFRYVTNRLTREGLTFDVVPAAGFETISAELESVATAWTRRYGPHDRRFSMGSFDPAYLSRFDTAVLRKEGRIVGFSNIWVSANRSEIAADLVRYEPDVSKVVMEGLFVHMMLYGRAQGYAYFDLGAAPMDGHADHPLASTWARIGPDLFQHGCHFQHADGLRAFKARFDPVWTPQYLACPRGLAIRQVLLDVEALITDARPAAGKPGTLGEKPSTERSDPSSARLT